MAKIGLMPIDEMVRRAIIGDGTAFTALWDTHIDALKSFLKGSIKGLDEFEIDDICSRSFEKAFRQIGSYDPSLSQFGTWLRSIAYHTALDVLDQKQRAQGKLVSLEDGLSTGMAAFTGDDASPLDTIIENEDREETENCIEGLPELYRKVAELRLVNGLQYKEIAEELQLELNTVRTRIRRAKSLIEKSRKGNCESNGK
ncbi:MAG: RNA polymerase sigma factor [Bacteroidales bacterium]|nr:RNA polymerase sigma factor [Bacteroidales bacterium]